MDHTVREAGSTLCNVRIEGEGRSGGVGAATSVRAKSVRRARVVAYLATSGLALALAVLWFHPWTASWQGVFPEANDLLWMQAQTEVHATSGPFGSTAHLSWPFDYNPWSHPVLGAFWACAAWLVGGVLGAPSALAVYVCWALSAALTASCLLFLFRSWLGNRLAPIAIVAASVTAVSSFALTRVIQPNVAAYFLVPFAIGAVARWSSYSTRGRVLLGFGLLLLAVGASLWWVIVAILFTLLMVLIEVLRRNWALARSASLVTVGLGMGFVIQTALYQAAVRDGAALTRGPWDSNLYGGHLVDLLMASPFLNMILPRLTSVSAGASTGASLIGFTSMLAAMGTLLIVLCGPPRSVGRRVDTAILADASVSAILLFIAGGLGNLQSGIAVILGGESPARVFSRLIVIVGTVGVTWALIGLTLFLDSRPRAWPMRQQQVVGGFACLLLLVFWLADAWQSPPIYFPVAESTLPEHAAMVYLTANTDPCPVAQLPQEGMPFVRTPPPAGESGRYYYRGLMPYLLAPEYSWSIGGWEPEGQTYLNALSTDLTETDLRDLEEMGFCAVLYDDRLAEAAQTSATPLEGRDRASDLRADFRSAEYSVYLLGSR